MGRYMRKCKGVVGEITVVEVANHSSGAACDNEMITRLKPNLQEDESSSSPPAASQKMKNKRTWNDGDRESSFDSANSSELMRNTRRRVEMESGTSSCQLLSAISGGKRSEDTFFFEPQPVSCCSSNVSGELVEDRVGTAPDPTGDERDNTEVETLTFSDARSERRTLLRNRTVESIVASPLEESQNPENNSTEWRRSEVNSGVETTTVNDEMPSEMEMEEFFTSAEKELQKCFTEKYNFDVVKEVALEGRYDWVRIKP